MQSAAVRTRQLAAWRALTRGLQGLEPRIQKSCQLNGPDEIYGLLSLSLPGYLQNASELRRKSFLLCQWKLAMCVLCMHGGTSDLHLESTVRWFLLLAFSLIGKEQNPPPFNHNTARVFFSGQKLKNTGSPNRRACGLGKSWMCHDSTRQKSDRTDSDAAPLQLVRSPPSPRPGTYGDNH